MLFSLLPEGLLLFGRIDGVKADFELLFGIGETSEGIAICNAYHAARKWADYILFASGFCRITGE